MFPSDDSLDEIEQESMQQLRTAAKEVRKIQDMFEALALTPIAEAKNANEIDHARKAYDELLLQQMMKVDGVESHGKTSIRTWRKEQLRHIEELHAALDAVKRKEVQAAKEREDAFANLF